MTTEVGDITLKMLSENNVRTLAHAKRLSPGIHAYLTDHVLARSQLKCQESNANVALVIRNPTRV